MKRLAVTFIFSFIIAAMILIPAPFLENRLSDYGIESVRLKGNIFTGTGTLLNTPAENFSWSIQPTSLLTLSPNWKITSDARQFSFSPALSDGTINNFNGQGKVTDLFNLLGLSVKSNNLYRFNAQSINLKGCTENNTIQLSAKRVTITEPKISLGTLSTKWHCKNNSWLITPELNNSDIKLSGQVMIYPDGKLITKLSLHSGNKQALSVLEKITQSRATRGAIKIEQQRQL